MNIDNNYTYFDCIWFITNLIKPFKDARYDEEACEKYFNITTRLESAHTHKDVKLITEAVTEASLDDYKAPTESPNIFSTIFGLNDASTTTSYGEEDPTTQSYLTTDINVKESTFAPSSIAETTGADSIYEDSTLTDSAYTSSAYTDSAYEDSTYSDTTYMRDSSTSFLDFQTDHVTEYQGAYDYATKHLMPYESMGYDIETTTTLAPEIQTTFQTTFASKKVMPYEYIVDYDAETTTLAPDIQSTFESTFDKEHIMPFESIVDNEMTTTMATDIPSTFDDYTTTNYSTPYETLLTELDVKSTFASSTTQGLIEHLNLTTLYDTTEKMSSSSGFNNATKLIEQHLNLTNLYDANEEMSTYTDFSDLDILKKPDILTVNLSLCEWYLPTVSQTPHALGKVGIALWVLGFVITFILIVLFIKQAIFIYKNAHKAYRRHLFSITSVYVFIAILTSIGSGIPRAHEICSAIKDVYMAIGIGHFVDLTISMYGGENIMAWYVKDKVINLRVLVFCKCFFCIKPCKIRRISISILKWIVWQMKWSQAAYYLLRLIIKKASENSLGVSPHDVSFWYLQVLNLISFLSGVISLLLINALVTDDLQDKYNYTIKAKLVRFTILTTKFQRLFFDLLEACGVFPCYPPYVSQKFYKNVLKDFIYLIEVLIIGVFTYIVYMRSGEFEEPNTVEIPRPMIEKENGRKEENGDAERDRMLSLNSNTLEVPDSVC